jgi:hypothetical protein
MGMERRVWWMTCVVMVGHSYLHFVEMAPSLDRVLLLNLLYSTRDW